MRELAPLFWNQTCPRLDPKALAAEFWPIAVPAPAAEHDLSVREVELGRRLVLSLRATTGYVKQYSWMLGEGASRVPAPPT